MSGHVNGLAIGVEAPHAGAHEDTGPEAAEASNHVDNARAGKVNVASVEKMGVSIPSIAHPAIGRPGPMDNNGIDPSRDEE